MVLRSGCAHWVSFWGVVAHGVRLPGSFAMVWRLCALMSVGGVVAHGCEAAQIGARVCGRRGVSAHSIEVARIVSEGAPGLSRCKIQYIYNVLGYYQTKNELN